MKSRLDKLGRMSKRSISSGTMSSSIRRCARAVHQKQLEELKKSTMALIDEIEVCEDFPPTESGLCPYCAYQDRCPLFAHKFQTDLLPPNEYAEEDGVALVDRLSKLDLKKRELKADFLAG